MNSNQNSSKLKSVSSKTDRQFVVEQKLIQYSNVSSNVIKGGSRTLWLEPVADLGDTATNIFVRSRILAIGCDNKYFMQKKKTR